MRPLIFASASMQKLTVDPEPTPMMPSCVYLSAASATCFFSSSWVIVRGSLFLLHRRHVGTDAFEELSGHADRFAGRRVRVDGLADVGRVGTNLDAERHLADEIAGARADDAGADDAMRLAVEDQLGEALVARVGDCATRGAPGEFRHADRGAGFLRLVLGHADPGDLRIGIVDRSDDARIKVRLLSRRVLGGAMRLLDRLVHEHRISRYVAHG